MQKIDFLKFYVINTSDNLPFQPYYSNPHVISFQKIHVLSVVQFMPKKNVCHRIVPYDYHQKAFFKTLFMARWQVQPWSNFVN